MRVLDLHRLPSVCSSAVGCLVCVRYRAEHDPGENAWRVFAVHGDGASQFFKAHGDSFDKGIMLHAPSDDAAFVIRARLGGLLCDDKAHTQNFSLKGASG